MVFSLCLKDQIQTNNLRIPRPFTLPYRKIRIGLAKPSIKDISKALTVLKDFPKLLKEEVSTLNESQLQIPYREGGWTVAQVVHHLDDSHSHAYLRCKHALLEDYPKIKGYTETDCAEQEDSTSSDLSTSLAYNKGDSSSLDRLLQ